MNIKIERFYGNRMATHGRLTIEGSTFTCYTLEACVPSRSVTRDKSVMALPEGTYHMQFAFIDMHYTLRVSCHGAYHHAQFAEGKDPLDAPPGSVILGTSFYGKTQIDGSATAMDALSRFLHQQMNIRQYNFRKLGEVTLTITHNPDFTFDTSKEATRSVDEMEEENWNLIDTL